MTAVIDRLVRILAEVGGPVGYRRISMHPQVADLTPPSLACGLSVAVQDGLIQQVKVGVYELTDAGRSHAG